MADVIFGTIQTTETTSIDLKGYSGINKIALNATGGKYALSFDNKATWKALVANSIDNSIIKNMTSNSNDECSISVAIPPVDPEHDIFEAFNDNGIPFISTATGAVIKVNFNRPRALSAFRVVCDNTSTSSALIISGSNDTTGMNWKDVVRTYTWPSPDIHTISTPAEYQYYLIAIESNTSTISKIELFEKITTYSWETITEADMAAKGMTKTVVEALQPSDYAKVFQQTQLDMFIRLENDETITSFEVTLPPNAAPAIRNTKLSSAEMHKGDVLLTADIIDPEGDVASYRILFNGTEFQPWQLVNGGKISVTLPDTLFLLGVNSIKIEAKDDRDAISNNEGFVTRINNAPYKVTSGISGNILRAVISDTDNDNISYRILFNGTEVLPWSAHLPAPLNINYTIDRALINIGVANTVKVEYKDDVDPTVFSYTEQFVGAYCGLLFTDAAGSFYSDDFGKVLKKLAFGTIIASQTSKAKEVFIVNKCGYNIKNTIINATKVLPQKVNIELSETAVPFVPVAELALGDLVQDQKKPFYVRIITSKDSSGGGDFNILAEGTPL